MVKDIIEYGGKKYQLSTVYLDSCIFKTMIFPIINGQVSGSEVYTFRTVEAGKSCNKHKDIYEHPEKYVSDEAIKKYLDLKEKDFKVSDIDKFREFFNEMNIGFTEKEYIPLNEPTVIVLYIDEKHFDPYQYYASLAFRFDKESGKLIYIEPYGE